MRHTANVGLRALTTLSLLLGLVLAGCEGDNVFASGEDPRGEDPTEDSRAPEVFIPPPDVPVEQLEVSGFVPVRDGVGVSVGDSILVAAQVTDNVGVTTVTFEGLAFRGDPAIGTDVVVTRFNPKTVELTEASQDTIIRRFLNPTQEDAREIVDIIVTATDTNGNVGTDTIQILIGGPSINFVNLRSEVVVGQTFSANVAVQDEEAVTQVVLEVTGAYDTTVVRTLDPAPAVDTVALPFIVPAGTTGQITIQATATNRGGLTATSEQRVLDLVTETTADDVPPSLLVDMQADSVLELSDVVAITVTGEDNPQGKGLTTLGFTLIVDNVSGDSSRVLTGQVAVDPADRSTQSFTFNIPVSDLNVDPVTLPDTLNLRAVGWAIDDAATPNCAASDGTDGDFEQLACTFLVTGERWALDENNIEAQGLELTERVVVSGRTIVLPNEEATISDAVVDTVRESVVLSNQTDDQLEIFDLQTLTFGDAILVGSEPWGLFFDRQGNNDVLLVGNSGGTNISRVDMNTRAEIISQRILTPNTLLFEVEETESEGTLEQDLTFYDFSDRPQFIAQDANRNIVYSTVPTGSAPDGTIRLADLTTPVIEVVLYTEHSQLQDAENTTAIWRVDDVDIGAGSAATLGDERVIVTDRVYGTNTVVTGSAFGFGAAGTAVANVQAQGSDARAGAGAWDIPGVGLSDTTFISSSGDGSRVAIGEGATAPTGRILIYDAATQSVSAVEQVIDLVGNADERVFGVDLNYDGSFGVARGELAVYFFTPDLRLQGSPAVEPGGAGAVLHPLHTDGPLNTNVNTAFAFVGSGEGTVDVYDTRHFSRIGQVTIRDNIAGPLRAVLPFAGDNAGLTCQMTTVLDGAAAVGQTVQVYSDANGVTLNAGSDDGCIVVKLVGITDSGGVVVIDVRKADLTRFHPAR